MQYEFIDRIVIKNFFDIKGVLFIYLFFSEMCSQAGAHFILHITYYSVKISTVTMEQGWGWLFSYNNNNNLIAQQSLNANFFIFLKTKPPYILFIYIYV